MFLEAAHPSNRALAINIAQDSENSSARRCYRRCRSIGIAGYISEGLRVRRNISTSDRNIDREKISDDKFVTYRIFLSDSLTGYFAGWKEPQSGGFITREDKRVTGDEGAMYSLYRMNCGGFSFYPFSLELFFFFYVFLPPLPLFEFVC